MNYGSRILAENKAAQLAEIVLVFLTTPDRCKTPVLG